MIAPQFPEKKYRTILIDPPWPVTHNQVDIPYDLMPISEIAALPVRQLTEENAYVFLWATNSMLPEAFGLLKLWKLKYVQLITWCKNYGLGRPPYTATEHLIMARVGNPLRSHSKGERDLNWFATQHKPKHSVKPDESYKLIERISDGPYLELFARRARKGWDGWGDQYHPEESQLTEPVQPEMPKMNFMDKTEYYANLDKIMSAGRKSMASLAIKASLREMFPTPPDLGSQVRCFEIRKAAEKEISKRLKKLKNKPIKP